MLYSLFRSMFRQWNRCNGLSSVFIINWWYMWLMSPTKATGFLRNLTSISRMSLCSLGPVIETLSSARCGSYKHYSRLCFRTFMASSVQPIQPLTFWFWFTGVTNLIYLFSKYSLKYSFSKFWPYLDLSSTFIRSR